MVISFHWVDDKGVRIILNSNEKLHELWQNIGMWQNLLAANINLERRLEKCRLLRTGSQYIIGVEEPKVTSMIKEMIKLNVELKFLQSFIQRSIKIYEISGKQAGNLYV